MRHFASTRAPEVLALQASPILGIFLGGFSLERGSVIRLGLLLLGSLALMPALERHPELDTVPK
jgi:hypothetical protein